MNNIRYTKRSKGGYYVFTHMGTLIVERVYQFSEPTKDWAARRKGEVTIGTSRKDAVERMVYLLTKDA